MPARILQAMVEKLSLPYTVNLFGTGNSKHSRFYIFRSASIESNRQGAHLRECTRGIGAEARTCVAAAH